MKIRVLHFFTMLTFFYSCSYYDAIFMPPMGQERHDFILFDPYLSTIVAQDISTSLWCFELRQGFRAIENWRFCFNKNEVAHNCFQKIARLQKNNRLKDHKKDLYRPGEVVKINYIRLRKEYLKKEIQPLQCLAFKTDKQHLIRSKNGQENWRNFEI